MCGGCQHAAGAMRSYCGAFNWGSQDGGDLFCCFSHPYEQAELCPCLRWPCSVGIAAAVARPLGGTWHSVASWAGRRDLPLRLGVAQTAGLRLIRCQRCLSLGFSALSRAPRANIPGIFVMFGSIQHPSEQKKIK